ncbi:MAG TPA: hypothetical protein VMZ50_04390 [Phycisphaerae bacterium]|nr:hypothetical protein [Phycisphaerae bacterium]
MTGGSMSRPFGWIVGLLIILGAGALARTVARAVRKRPPAPGPR